MTRYAIYFAPDRESPLWRFGNAWLGRDVETGEPLIRPSLSGLSGLNLDELTASPRLYGFHATLKPPFRLSEGCSFADLIRTCEDFVSTQKSFNCPMVAPAELGNFVAFKLLVQSKSMIELAANAVEVFEPFRAPQTEKELAKRRAAGLTGRQEENLLRWGYPYVMEDFRFHMTLTSAIAADGLRSKLTAGLISAAEAAGAVGPMEVSGVSLYEQVGSDQPFRLIRRFPFKG